MKGAREYYYPFFYCYKSLGLEKMNDGYYKDHLLFRFGEHARGKELFVYVVKDVNELKEKGIYRCEKLEVYGVVSGNPGWTETYGFLLDGKWKPIIQDLFDKSILMYEEYQKESERIKLEDEQNKKAQLLKKAEEFNSLF